ncbi:hypothetical protein HPB50_001950 [Hyalomma asiaticum]|uniref:Uncharacterized protein n=1 Tax=Hyalomma asiaticum TaxID=266040 RepID=A0ACB7RLH1_HYAAI|nr:hypothetical protein HPB50_001950 [Hyalomma asiaticum]
MNKTRLQDCVTFIGVARRRRSDALLSLARSSLAVQGRGRARYERSRLRHSARLVQRRSLTPASRSNLCASADELVVASSEAVPGKVFAFLPTYHDQFLPKVPAVAVRKGFFDASVDLLTGVTSDEGLTPLVWPRPWPELLSDNLDNMDRETLKSSITRVITSWLSDDAAELLDQYAARATDHVGVRRQLLDYLSERLFVCPMHVAAAAHAARGGAVYSYVFDQWPTQHPPFSWAGVGHGMDLAYTAEGSRTALCNTDAWKRCRLESGSSRL